MKKLGFGMMRLPILDANDPGSIDFETLNAMVDEYLASGYNYFDTALMYCGEKSEAAVKKALVERHPRDSFTVTTKLHACYLNTKEDRDRIFQEQMERMGVDFFDYYLIHDINAVSLETYNKLDCFAWIQEKKAQGLAKHIGFSFHDSAELLDEVLCAHPEFEFVQLQINYLDWDSAGVQSRRCYEVAVKHGKTVFVMEPVKGGTLANVPRRVEESFKAAHPDWTVPAWAIRFAASLPSVQVVLSGMSTMQQVKDNAATMTDVQAHPFTDAENKLVMDAAKAIRENVAIPCTGCAYCMEGCPQKINIPRAFSLYNTDKQECDKPWAPQEEYYENMVVYSGKASSCIECGQCEQMCPQHLPIIEHLKTVARYFEHI